MHFHELYLVFAGKTFPAPLVSQMWVDVSVLWLLPQPMAVSFSLHRPLLHSVKHPCISFWRIPFHSLFVKGKNLLSSFARRVWAAGDKSDKSAHGGQSWVLELQHHSTAAAHVSRRQGHGAFADHSLMDTLLEVLLPCFLRAHA